MSINLEQHVSYVFLSHFVHVGRSLTVTVLSFENSMAFCTEQDISTETSIRANFTVSSPRLTQNHETGDSNGALKCKLWAVTDSQTETHTLQFE